MKTHPSYPPTWRSASRYRSGFSDLEQTLMGEPADRRLRAEFDEAIAAANAGLERACAALREGDRR